MDRQPRDALKLIRRCVANGRYHLTAHCIRRLDERGVVWPDVLTALDDPEAVRADGVDDFARERWIVHGHAADGLAVAIVCALDHDDAGELTLFITLYWD